MPDAKGPPLHQKRKLAVITTGGTIGSILRNASIGLDPTGATLHAEVVRLFDNNDSIFEVISAINKHSEDIVPEDWSTILETIDACLRSGTDRIVITHGTDTLPYTAAAVALLFNEFKARICLTGSFHSLEHPQSDVHINLISAFNCVILDEIPTGVYVAFRNDTKNRSASIIHAYDLKPMAFDEVVFKGIYGRFVAKYSSDHGFSINLNNSAIQQPFIGGPVPKVEAIRMACDSVSQIITYPGFNLKWLDSNSSLRALIVSLYHSGTANAINQNSGILEFVTSHRDVCVMLAAYPGENLETPYESTLRLISGGAQIYRDIQPHVLYVALALALAQGRRVKDVSEAFAKFAFRPSPLSESPKTS
jgi:glutamyl-tRNA(Gln) amidotransferase subunit D